MKCIKCGELLPKGAVFCDKCGARQTEEIKCSCGRLLEDDCNFCPECGKSLKGETAADKKAMENKLKKAALDGMKKAFSFASECGVDLDCVDGVPLIVQASADSESELVEALLEAGADVDACDSDSNTALHKACENGDKDIVKILLDNNADANMENYYEETPLSLARDNGSRYIVGLLHKAGAEEDDDEY